MNETPPKPENKIAEVEPSFTPVTGSESRLPSEQILKNQTLYLVIVFTGFEGKSNSKVVR